jgi:hypothetical protein
MKHKDPQDSIFYVHIKRPALRLSWSAACINWTLNAQFNLINDTQERSICMGLNRQHQLQLIKDILTDHQLDCCGTVAEYEQVGRVIQLMLAKEDLDADIRQLLTDIYDYSQKGTSVSSIDAHIEEHQSHLSEWVENIPLS